MTLAAQTIESNPDSIYQSRVDLAAAHRLANRFGFDDGIHNHFTLMVPGTTDQFFVKAHGLLMSEITANNLIVVDTQGNVIDGSGTIERSAFFIHAAIHLHHPDAKCVLHAHPPCGNFNMFSVRGSCVPDVCVLLESRCKQSAYEL